MPTTELTKETQIVVWTGWYLFNNSTPQIVEDIYGTNITTTYAADKAELIADDRMYWFMNLDIDHQNLVVAKAVEKYGGK